MRTVPRRMRLALALAVQLAWLAPVPVAAAPLSSPLAPDTRSPLVSARAQAASALQAHVGKAGPVGPAAVRQLGNLAVAQRILADPSPIAAALALGPPPAPRPSRPPRAPSAILAELAQRNDIHLTAEQADDVAALDGLGPAIVPRLSDTLEAFLAFDAAARRSWAAVDVADLTRRARAEGPDFGLDSLRAMGVDLDGVAAARAGFLQTIPDLAAAFERRSNADTASADSTNSAIRACPLIAFDVLGGPDEYTQWDDCILVLDVGGDDHYQNNAGGTGLTNLIGQPCAIAAYAGATALIDLQGNDRYDANRDCGQNGGAHSGGAGFLYDATGNDYYQGGSYGTNGGAFIGSGFLLDGGGGIDYVYASDSGTNGGVAAGTGALIDGADEVVFNAGSFGTNGGGYNGGSGAMLSLGARSTSSSSGYYGTNGGGCGGAGFVLDVGNSNGGYYQAGGVGTNGGAVGTYPCTTGGVGFLLDAVGPGGFYGDNGGGVAEAVGTLIGPNGDNSYTGRNGGGTSAGVGVLVDSLGNDSYSGGYGGTNGGAMAEGSGYLVDLGGHDTYTSSSGTGVNGGGFTGGVGYLNDVSGNDHYSAGQCAVNGGGWTGSCYGTVTSAGSGTLLDNSGDDTYSDGDGGSGSNVTIAAKGTAGRQIDGPSQGPGAPTLLTLGEVAIHGTAALPKFPCEPPPPLGNGPCAGSFDGDWAANVSGIRNGNVFSATWNTASGHAIHAGFDYSEWQCLAGTETLLGIAAGTGSATVAPGELQGKWQVPGESFARDIVGATASFTFTWNRVATGAVLSLSPTTLSLDVAGLGPQVVVTGAQLGVATLVVTSTGNTTVPMCGTPLTNVRGDIAGVVWLAS